ncbi:hypothetical protein KAR91_63000 [Candidatus Pacearchaeota archaeon]|nr:hypothetical protein [Candidatus Pacearchaeota archaeon]
MDFLKPPIEEKQVIEAFFHWRYANELSYKQAAGLVEITKGYAVYLDQAKKTNVHPEILGRMVKAMTQSIEKTKKEQAGRIK